MRAASLFLVTGLALFLAGACSSTPPDGDDTGGAAGAASGGQATGGQPDGSGGKSTGGNDTGGQGSGGGTGGIPETCGDGHIDQGEECDDGQESEDCNANCTESECGDGITNEADGEDCDDGEATETCNADCTAAACGNGIVDDFEDCDDGEETANCNANCTESVCGDGVTNEADGEDCDDAGDSEDCDADCTLVSCGDGHVNAEADEECEGELVHEGQTLTINYCVECKKNVCGDLSKMQITLAGLEICDFSGVCSDIPAEDCDSGGVDTELCDFDCTNATCGDGYWNALADEECDDGNKTPGDGCSAGCQVE